MNPYLATACIALAGITFWAWVISSVISLARTAGLS